MLPEAPAKRMGQCASRLTLPKGENTTYMPRTAGRRHPEHGLRQSSVLTAGSVRVLGLGLIGAEFVHAHVQLEGKWEGRRREGDEGGGGRRRRKPGASCRGSVHCKLNDLKQHPCNHPRIAPATHPGVLADVKGAYQVWSETMSSSSWRGTHKEHGPLATGPLEQERS